MSKVGIVCEKCTSKLYELDADSSLYYCPICMEEKVVQALMPATSFLIDTPSLPEDLSEAHPSEDGFEENEFILDSTDLDQELLAEPDGKELRKKDSFEIQEVISKKRDGLKQVFDAQKSSGVIPIDADKQYVDAMGNLIKEEDKKGGNPLVNVFIGFLAILMFVVGFLAWSHHQNSQLDKKLQAQLHTEQVSEKVEASADDFRNAKEFAITFLRAENLIEAQSYVIPDESIEKRMAEYWTPTQGVPKLKFILLNYLPGSKHAAFYFQHILKSGDVKKVLVFMTPDKEFFFDWRSYEAVQDFKIKELSERLPDTSCLMRAKLRGNDYYNFGYKEGRWKSYKLYDPNKNKPSDLWINAYASTELAREIERVGNNGKQRLLLDVKWTGKVIEIIDVISHKPAEYSLSKLSDFTYE